MHVSSVRLRGFQSFEDSGDVPLGRLTVFTGRNNSGKSAITQALACGQQNLSVQGRPTTRVGRDNAEVFISLADFRRSFFTDLGQLPDGMENAGVIYAINLTNQPTRGLVAAAAPDAAYATAGWHADEPNNFLFPIFAARKGTYLSDDVNVQATNSIRLDMGNLPAKVLRLISGDMRDEFDVACMRMLGIRVRTTATQQGQQIASLLPGGESIALTAMGEGVRAVVSLLVCLFSGHGRLFVIEEPENDLHPLALKALLEVIIRASEDNQVVVTTHSAIVATRLGAEADCKLYEVRLDTTQTPPVSSVVPILDRAGRIELLISLGNEPVDLDLWEGWLILEEASAESLIREVLIPWFVPYLARIRTVSAAGASRTVPVFDDYVRLFLFAHLEPHYRGRCWVIADGDPTGLESIQRLRDKYPGWPTEHFRNWTRPQFEMYYPPRFVDQVSAVETEGDPATREALKRAVRADVKGWADAEPVEARAEFAQSAAEVIHALEEIADHLRSLSGAHSAEASPSTQPQ
jgi:predicted ATPase